LKSFIHAYTHAVATHIAVTMAALKPPFTIATAHQKVKFAQAMWNTCNPAQVSKGYTSDCIWRNRDRFIKGTDEIIMNKIAVQFWYEYRDKYDGMKWKRCYGLEDWTFNVSDPHVRTLQE
jgi:nuclear transport factor 2 (NTF2) superfamily protein